MIQKLRVRFCLFALCLGMGLGLVPPDQPLASRPAVAAAEQQQQQQQQQQDQGQQDQQKKKKKGGVFGGMKAVSGESSEQQEATATAGSKSVGEGEKIGSVTPTSADRQQVGAMANYTDPQNDLKKFQEDGRLKPKQ